MSDQSAVIVVPSALVAHIDTIVGEYARRYPTLTKEETRRAVEWFILEKGIRQMQNEFWDRLAADMGWNRHEGDNS